MDGILTKPHPAFEVIKRRWPHFFLPAAKNGDPVYVEASQSRRLSFGGWCWCAFLSCKRAHVYESIYLFFSFFFFFFLF